MLEDQIDDDYWLYTYGSGYCFKWEDLLYAYGPESAYYILICIFYI